VEQLDVEHELPPWPAGDDVPAAANIEINLFVLVDWHCGHWIELSWPPRTSSSNSVPHFSHLNSYIGICNHS
jgi:hypothetical protein